MITFVFRKLVRDKLRQEYERMGQKATYRPLTQSEHAVKLQQKLIEEANEIPLNGSKEDITNELADVQQVLDDLAALNGISTKDVKIAQQEKFEKKGSFSGGTYVETLTLTNDDEWVTYYRKHPDIFRELKDK